MKTGSAATAKNIITTPQEEFDSLRFISTESPCPYLPNRLSRHETYGVNDIDGKAYRDLMSMGFRRCGSMVYRPRCRSCSECCPIRIPLAEWKLSKSLRRVWRMNHDVQVEVGTPTSTHEKFALFQRYLEARHDGAMARTVEAFEEFLYHSPTETLEFRYTLEDHLVAVSIADRCSDGLSSVYHYYDPDLHKRSLGAYSVLWEVEWCRQVALDYYYLGFYVAGSKTMSYKARFRPHELLNELGRWVPPCP
ncbi:MAG: arginyltransferase [Planctomycetota bacterium]